MRIKLDDSILYKNIFSSGLSGDTDLFSPEILSLLENAAELQAKGLSDRFPNLNLENLCQFESEVHGQPVEHLGLFDYDGSLYMHTVGDANSAPLDEDLDDEDTLWYYIHNIAVLTHNHPDGDISFSPNDVAIACFLQLEELRAVSDNYVYILKPNPAMRWNAEYFTGWIKNILNNEFLKLKEEMSERIENGLPEFAANNLFWHIFWQRAAKTTNMQYIKTSYPDGKCVVGNDVKELEFSGIGDGIGETRDMRFVDLLQKYVKTGNPQDNIDKYFILAAKVIDWDYKGINKAIKSNSNNNSGATRFLITERADNFSHGKPYMVTDLNKIVSISAANSFINPDRIEELRSKDNCIAVNNKPNGFGNFQAITIEPEYETMLFHTRQQAEQYVKEYSITASDDSKEPSSNAVIPNTDNLKPEQKAVLDEIFIFYNADTTMTIQGVVRYYIMNHYSGDSHKDLRQRLMKSFTGMESWTKSESGVNILSAKIIDFITINYPEVIAESERILAERKAKNEQDRLDTERYKAESREKNKAILEENGFKFGDEVEVNTPDGRHIFGILTDSPDYAFPVVVTNKGNTYRFNLKFNKVGQSKTVEQAKETGNSVAAKCEVVKSQFNGRDTIRITFKSKPDNSVLLKLRNKGFNWYKNGSYWGAFYTDSLWQWANDFCGGDAETTTNNASILDPNSKKADKKETTGKGSLPFIQHLIVNSIIFPDPDDTWAVKSETFIDGKGDIYIKETRISDKFHRDENGEFPTHDEWLKVGKAGGKQRSWVFGKVPDDIKPIDIPKKVFVPKEKRQPHYNLKYSDYKNRVILNSLILQQEIILGKMEFAKHRYFDGMVDGWEYIKKDEMHWHSSRKGLTDISYDEKPYHSGDNDIHWGSYYLRYNGRNAPEFIVFGEDAKENKPVKRTYSDEERQEIADKLKDKANSLRGKAETKRNSGTHNQNWTRRRASIMASQEKDAELLEEMAEQLEKLSDLWINNAVPDALVNIRNVSELEILRLSYPEFTNGASQWYMDEVTKKQSVLNKIGIFNKEQFNLAKTLIEDLKSDVKPEQDKARAIKAMEDKYRRLKIEGFFPTDNLMLADELIDLAEIKPGDRILEPSAGLGHLAERIRARFPDNTLDVIEIRPGFVEVLKEKGFNVVGTDFMEFDKKYDKIIMNPPFENNQDVDHVIHAFDLLNPGGIVASIIGGGSIGGSLRKRQDFEAFLEDNDAYVSGTIIDAFKKSFNSTNVAVKLVSVTKPGSKLNPVPYEPARIDYDNIQERKEDVSPEDVTEIPDTDGSVIPVFDKNDLDYGVAMNAYRGISFDPEQRARGEQEFYQQDLFSIYDDLLKLANTPEKQEILNSEMSRFKENWLNKYQAYLMAKSRTMSTMITGRSNFPTEQNQKRMQTEDNRYKEWSEWREWAIKAIKDAINPKEVLTADQEIERLKKKIESAKAVHEKMKQINVILRKKGSTDEELIAKMKEAGFSDTLIANAMKPNYSGKREIEGWQLSNNLANIKRMEERLQELQKKNSTETNEFAFDGGVIVDSREEDRIMIKYDEKPDSDTISKLKSNGFKWSPRNMAWQRMRTLSTKSLIRRMFNVDIDSNNNGKIDMGNMNNETESLDNFIGNEVVTIEGLSDLSGFRELVNNKIFAIDRYANDIFPIPVKVSVNDWYLSIGRKEDGVIIGRIDLSNGRIDHGQYDLFSGKVEMDDYLDVMMQLKKFIWNYKVQEADKNTKQASLFGFNNGQTELIIRENKYLSLLKRLMVASEREIIDDNKELSIIEKYLEKTAKFLNRNYREDWENLLSEYEGIKNPGKQNGSINAVPTIADIDNKNFSYVQMFFYIPGEKGYFPVDTLVFEPYKTKAKFILSDWFDKFFPDFEVVFDDEKNYKTHGMHWRNKYKDVKLVEVNIYPRTYIKEAKHEFAYGYIPESDLADILRNPILLSYANKEFSNTRQNGGESVPDIPTKESGNINIVYGDDTTIETPSEKIQAKYAVMDLYDIQPSNNPGNFSKNPKYPAMCQTRNYEADKAEQLKVIRNADNFDYRFLINNTPTAVDGPPIVLSTGAVLGGNSRAMSLYRVANAGDFNNKYGYKLEAFLGSYGINRDLVKMKNPVLVRIVDVDISQCGRYSNILNKGLTQEYDEVTEGIAFAQQLSEAKGAYERIAEILSNSEAESFAEMMNDRYIVKELTDVLTKLDIINAQNINKLINQDKTFSETGKNFIKIMLLASILPDKRLIGTTKSYTDKIIKTLPLFIRMKHLPVGWNLVNNVHEAIKLESDRKDKGLTIDEMLSQGNMFTTDPVSDRTAFVWKALNGMGINNFKAFMTYYVSQAEQSENGGDMFGTKTTPEEIFKNWQNKKGMNGLGDYLIPEQDELYEEEEDQEQEKPEELLALPGVRDIMQKASPKPIKLARTKGFFQRMLPNIKIFMYGPPGSGKSTFALFVGEDFALNGNVLYVCAEEGLFTGRLKERIKRNKIRPDNIEFLETKELLKNGRDPREEIIKRLVSGKYQYVIIDSINVLEDQGIFKQPELMSLIEQLEDRLSFVVIAQVAKDKRKFKGSSSWPHLVDSEIKVENGIATFNKHRDAPDDQKFIIFPSLKNWGIRKEIREKQLIVSK